MEIFQLPRLRHVEDQNFIAPSLCFSVKLRPKIFNEITIQIRPNLVLCYFRTLAND